MGDEAVSTSARQAQVMNEHSYSTFLYKPLHVQRAEKLLNLDQIIKSAESALHDLDHSDDELEKSNAEFLKKFKPIKIQAKRERGRPSNGIVTESLTEKGKIRQSLYVTDNLKYKRKWLRDMLLSDSESSDDDNDLPITEAKLKQMLREHVFIKNYQTSYPKEPGQLVQTEYKDYTYGVLGQSDFPAPVSELELNEIKKKLVTDLDLTECKKKRVSTSNGKPSPSVKGGKVKSAGEKKKRDENGETGESGKKVVAGDVESEGPSTPSQSGKGSKSKKAPTAESLLSKRKKMWHAIVKKDISKAAKARTTVRKEMMSNAKKCAVAIQKQRRKEAIAAQRSLNSIQSRMKKISREVVTYWKKFEKEEKLQQKKVEKEAQEQMKQDLNLLEAKRQARKLNFLITQTELYAHFMATKLGTASESDKTNILSRLEEKDGPKLHNETLDQYDPDAVKDQVLLNAEDAYVKQTTKTEKFDQKSGAAPSIGFANPTGESNYAQPSIFVGKLKTYQVKGMNWLADLYSQGINGILADEMGLGKTVQSIAFLAHVAEVHGVWGPFLVVAPASTLHNWQQEAARFLPKMRVVPYWGTTQERKILRKFWDQQNLHTEQASFHILITSYQLIIQDCKYFSRINWHYMVLDEAQALKSSSSTRWKTLLSFNCRNRLLLTGTPIQNSMAELWALLHFIMPTLFDSHDEFNEWFSKDIESHAEKGGTIDQNHLSRLHMILKPFMLRRIKKDVENDLTDKIEVLVYCPLTIRQRYLYEAIKRKIRIEDLLAGVSHAAAASNASSSLMNLVMQFRKVCNHPELFERRDIKSPAYMSIEPYVLPKLIYREGILQTSIPSKQHLLHKTLYIHNSEHVHNSTIQNTTCQTSKSECDNLFSWLRLVGLSSGELNKIMISGVFSILNITFQIMKERKLLNHQKSWQPNKSPHSTPYMKRRTLLVSDERPTDYTNRSPGGVMSQLVFTDYTSHTSSHLTHNMYYMKETSAHRKIRAKHNPELLGIEQTTAPVTPMKSKRAQKAAKVKSDPLPAAEDETTSKELGSYHSEKQRLHRSVELQLTDIPTFLSHLIPKAFCAPLQCYCSDRSARYDYTRGLDCGSPEAKQMLRLGPQPYNPNYWHTDRPGGLQAIRPPFGFSNIYIPDKRSMIVDAGKMHVLDELLTKLKKEGHRVLIYSTMTKVIDLLEEFMWYRKHQYMRLDGSSKISERRDMVSDFQNKTDIFVFLLSTRAGGLGINLTAADTVIFYDSDWNPTVDAQAMDRAHRLGQTKQVTVYRLICKGTIEERILERAREKEEIQRMVISGNNDFKPDVLKAKEVVSLLIDDESLKQKLEQAQDSKKLQVEKRKQAAAQKKADGPKPKRVRKTPGSASSTPRGTPLSHTTIIHNGSSETGETGESATGDIDVDILTADNASSRASSPAMNSAPSTPSVRASTPQSSKARGKPPAKRSATSRGAAKSKSAAALKKSAKSNASPTTASSNK